MEITFHLDDVGMQAIWESLLNGLPSLEPEERAQRAKELGREPVCRENAAARVFMDGLLNFARGHIVADYANLRTRITAVCTDAILLTRAKLKAAEEKHGQGSPDYLGMSQLLAGAEMVVNVLEKILTSESPGTKAPDAPPTKPRKPKTKKKGAKR